MEDRRGIFSYLGGIARVALIVALVAILAFFVIRWVKARQNNRRAEQATKTVSLNKGNTGKNTENSEKQSSGESSKETDGSNPIQIPKGIADSEATPPTSGAQMPNAGISPSVLLTTIMLSVSTYCFMMYLQSTQLTRQQ